MKVFVFVFLALTAVSAFRLEPSYEREGGRTPWSERQYIGPSPFIVRGDPADISEFPHMLVLIDLTRGKFGGFLRLEFKIVKIFINIQVVSSVVHLQSAPDGHSQLLTVSNVTHQPNIFNYVVDQQTEILADSSSKHNLMHSIHNTIHVPSLMTLLLFKFKLEHQSKD